METNYYLIKKGCAISQIDVPEDLIVRMDSQVIKGCASYTVVYPSGYCASFEMNSSDRQKIKQLTAADLIQLLREKEKVSLVKT